MKILPTLAFATASVVVALPAPSRAQMPDLDGPQAALEFLQRLGLQYSILVARTAVDLTYESMSVDARNSETVLNNVVIRPRLAWDPELQCEIRMDRLAASGASSFERFESNFEISGASVPAICLDPGAGAMLQSFGYPVIDIARASISMGYDLPSSGADLLISADVVEAAEVTVAADFDYIFVTGLLDDGGSGEPEPVAKLSSAEVIIENGGLWERVSPMLGAQFGDVNQIPAMVGPMLSQVLAAPGQPLGPTEQALINNLSTELARFIENGDRLVLSMAPDGGSWISEETFETPQSAIAALEPRLSPAPLAIARMVPTDLLAAAMAGGEALDDVTRLQVGAALISGVGAPRALAEGKAMVAPLAEAWNADAATLMGEAMAAEGDMAGAYVMALRGLAGGGEGALGLADDLESALAPGTILASQGAVLEAWPELGAWGSVRAEAEQSGNVPAIRRLAFAAASGQGAPRSYSEAYYLASLAAAAGDSAAAGLRDRLDLRFTSDGVTDPDWVAVSGQAGSAALEAWIEGGVAAAVEGAYRP
ncbi:MAG: hypothetical protein AAGC57_00910 [Pseudomonadota bacterium]